MKTYMLVHGAWHGAWSYDETKARLERAGARVITFDLPGHGSDTTDVSAVTMQGYVDAVKRQLTAAAAPVTLVGHSLSGFVVSQAAEEMPEQVKQLIFVAAMVPHSGKSIFDEINEDSQSELLQNLIFAEDKSWATVSEDTLKKVVYNGASPQQIAAAAPRLVRQATQPFFAKVTTSERAFGAIEKVYIVCEKDNIFSSGAQHRVARIIGARLSSLPTGHVPHVEDPTALAAAIASV